MGQERAFLPAHLTSPQSWASLGLQLWPQTPFKTLPLICWQAPLEPASEGSLACTSVPLPPPPPTLFQPQASSGSCTRLPQPSLLARGPWGQKVELSGNAAAGAAAGQSRELGGRKRNLGPFLGPGQWTGNRCLGTSFSIPGLRKSQPNTNLSAPSHPHPYLPGHSLDMVNQYLLNNQLCARNCLGA